MPRFRELAHVGIVLALLAGCGEKPKDLPKLGLVTGVVKVDDKPLAKASVQFVPQTSRMSSGITDAEGKYELMFNASLKGAAVGQHQVRISSASSAEIPETLPPRYNTQTELTAVVKEGTNTINFNLKTK